MEINFTKRSTLSKHKVKTKFKHHTCFTHGLKGVLSGWKSGFSVGDVEVGEV